MTCLCDVKVRLADDLVRKSKLATIGACIRAAESDGWDREQIEEFVTQAILSEQWLELCKEYFELI